MGDYKLKSSPDYEVSVTLYGNDAYEGGGIRNRGRIMGKPRGNTMKDKAQ